MKLEQRYIILKMKDLELLNDERLELVRDAVHYVDQARTNAGKRPLEAVVIEKGWPEYEPTVALLSARVDGQEAPTGKKVGELTLEVGMRTATAQDERERVAAALRACDWSGTPIGNKAIVQRACELLTTRPAQTEQQPEQSGLVEALDSILSNLDENLPGCFTLESRGDFDAAAAIEQAHAALSQQSEPVCPFCGEPSDHCNQSFPHPSKPAPAQDEREMGELRIRLENGRRQFEFEEYDAAYSLPAGTHYLYTRPAQTEQKPVAQARASKKVGELMVEVGFSANKVSELVQFIIDAVAEGGMTAECGEELGRHLQALAVTEVSPDANVELNRKMLLDRSVVGLKKYGVTTEREDLTPAQWAQHAIEEALDFANYLQALKRKLEDLDNG